MTLTDIADRAARERGREVALVCTGLDNIPAAYAQPLREILTELIHNALTYGIESPADRQRAGKPIPGTLAIELVDRGEQGVELSFEDDGQGVDHERLRATAIARGLLTPEAAAAADPRQLVSYLFKPGFATTAAGAGESGGTLGMVGVRSAIAQLGGHISLSSRPGKFTRFRITLPLAGAAAVRAAAG